MPGTCFSHSLAAGQLICTHLRLACCHCWPQLQTLSPCCVLQLTAFANGTYQVTKHLAMGRQSFELPYVMPDNRTVYMTDDGACCSCLLLTMRQHRLC